MQNVHTEKLTINDTNINFNSIVPVTELMKLFQIATFNHSQQIELDHDTMLKKSNAFWVVTKMKLCLNDNIRSQEKVSVTTWTHELGTIRAMRDCLIKIGRTVKVKGVAEWCCLDYETRKIRKLSSIVYPNLEMKKTTKNNITFSNLREDVGEKNKVYSKTIRSTDIDLNNHTNNMVYNTITFDALSIEEQKNFDVKEYEVYFVNESYEGDIIDVYKKKVRNYIYIEGKTGDKTIFRSVIKVKNRK